MTPGTESGKGCQPGYCGCVNQVQGLGKGVNLETEHVTPGIGLSGVITMKIVDM